MEEDKLYKYQKITFDKYILYVRSSVDGYELVRNEKKEILLRNFMEIDPRKWMKKWATAKNIVMTDCCDNNTSKVLQWLTQAYLSEVENIKIAFITRFTSQTPKRHKIIGVENRSVKDLSKIYRFSMNGALNNIKVLLDGMLRLSEDGNFVFNKLGYKNYAKLFKTPIEEEEDDEDESDDEEEEEEE